MLGLSRLHGAYLGMGVPVNPFRRRPAGDDHVEVVDARIATSTVGQGMLQVALVVALREVGALVTAARLLAGQSAKCHRLGRIEHETQLQGCRQLRVEAMAPVTE